MNLTWVLSIFGIALVLGTFLWWMIKETNRMAREEGFGKPKQK